MSETYNWEDLLSRNADDDKCFYLENGNLLKNLGELKNFLASCTADNYQYKIFYKHVDGDRNDFANWARHVFDAGDLADRIQKAKGPIHMLEEIDNYAQEYARKRAEFLREDEKNTASLKKDISARTDLSEKTWDKISKIKQRMIYDKNSHDSAVEVLREKYAEISRAITEHRKDGADMSIPSMLLRNILPKIDYFQVSQNKDDEERVNDLLDEVAQEINYAKSWSPKDLKQEVLEAARDAAKIDAANEAANKEANNALNDAVKEKANKDAIDASKNDAIKSG
jgi:hypothetical protein